MKIFRSMAIMFFALATMTSCATNTEELKDLRPVTENPTTDERTDEPGSSGKIVVGYVTSWSGNEVKPEYVTHINYAFGSVENDFKSINISNEARLKTIVALKRVSPALKVLLSIGGWGSGNFSEMAGTAATREAFAANCRRMVDTYGLDGIDIDWEYPTSSAAQISSSPEDTRNYTLMMRDIRQAVGKDKLLTLAASCDAGYIDYKAVLPYIDFINIMDYDMGNPPSHNAPLYASSKHPGWYDCDKSVKAFLSKGVPATKLVLGMPFYGHGKGSYGNFVDFKDIKVADGCTECWDDEAKVPFITDKDGNFVLSSDNARSIGLKCDYILSQDLLGGMFWDDAGDNSSLTLHKVIAGKLLKKGH